jgi:prepilin-type N-terminal cleavage/methylation domain-containing protein
MQSRARLEREKVADTMTMQLPMRLADRRGYTMIEALVSMAIAGVLIGSALPHVDTRREAINTAVNAVIADLRYARSRSITTGTHHALELTDAGTYEVQRLTQDAIGLWVVDSVAKTNAFPDHVTLELSQPVTLEFNTRGMMISSTGTLTLSFTDTQFGATHQVSIWPSGQIYYEL